MPSRRIILLAFCFTTLTYFENIDCLRLCGRRLADALSDICQQNGGFHSPITKRSVTKMNRISAATETSASIHAPRFTEVKGVVEECCYKACSTSTLLSYCSNTEKSETNVPSLLRDSSESLSISTEIDDQIFSNPSEGFVSPSSNLASEKIEVLASNRPNLGRFIRNRPVFIILPPDLEDANLEEYYV